MRNEKKIHRLGENQYILIVRTKKLTSIKKRQQFSKEMSKKHDQLFHRGNKNS